MSPTPGERTAIPADRKITASRLATNSRRLPRSAAETNQDAPARSPVPALSCSKTLPMLTEANFPCRS